ncbi:hypothetical protein COO60DRAFT_1496225 [Scenedesmus sp. NREL 46B-D3]|nr:hypothetical protein COO60DRAFT_1496225 [Scenedesmus sp. NREL 46B-D3]
MIAACSLASDLVMPALWIGTSLVTISSAGAVNGSSTIITRGGFPSGGPATVRRTMRLSAYQSRSNSNSINSTIKAQQQQVRSNRNASQPACFVLRVIMTDPF